MTPDPKKVYKDNLVDRSIVPSYMFNGQLPRYISGSGYILPRMTLQCLLEQGELEFLYPLLFITYANARCNSFYQNLPVVKLKNWFS